VAPHAQTTSIVDATPPPRSTLVGGDCDLTPESTIRLRGAGTANLAKFSPRELELTDEALPNLINSFVCAPRLPKGNPKSSLGARGEREGNKENSAPIEKNRIVTSRTGFWILRASG